MSLVNNADYLRSKFQADTLLQLLSCTSLRKLPPDPVCARAQHMCGGVSMICVVSISKSWSSSQKAAHKELETAM